MDQGLELLNSLNRVISELPLLIIGSYRDYERPTLPDELPGSHLLKLTRFTDKTMAQMSRSMLGEVGNLPGILELLQRETEGNAFFMVEAIRALADDAGRLSDIGRKTLPEKLFVGGVQQIVHRRLERIPTAMQAWLKLAAVLGRELDLGVLSVCIRQTTAEFQPAQLDRWLRTCADAAVLEILDGSWHFRHDKLRQMLIEGLNAAELRELNALVALGIETVYENDLSRVGSLFEHWSAAGETSKAVGYALTFLKQLHVQAEYGTLINIAQRGLDLLSNQTSEETIKLKMKFLERVGSAYHFMSDSVNSLTAFNESLALAKQLGDPRGEADAISGIGLNNIDQGDFISATSLIDQARTIYEGLGVREQVSRTISNLGIVAYYRGDMAQAQILFQDALVIGDEINNPVRVAGSLINLGSVALVRGKRVEAHDYWEQSLTVMRQIGDQRGIAKSLHGLGSIARDQGELAAARNYYQEGLVIFKRAGNVSSQGQLINELGGLSFMEGDFSGSRRAFEQNLEIRRAINDRREVAIILNALGNLRLFASNYTEADAYLKESLNILQELGAQAEIAQVLCDFGFLRLARDVEADLISKSFCDCLALAQSHEIVSSMLASLIGFAWLRLRNGHPLESAHLVGMVTAHPGFTAVIQFTYVNKLQRELQAMLSPDDLKHAYQHGGALDANETLTALLQTCKTA